MGAISDRIGRRLALNLSFGLGIVFLLLLMRIGADKMLLFLLLGGLSACAFAILGLFGLIGGLILSFFIRETAPRFAQSPTPAA